MDEIIKEIDEIRRRSVNDLRSITCKAASCIGFTESCLYDVEADFNSERDKLSAAEAYKSITENLDKLLRMYIKEIDERVVGIQSDIWRLQNKLEESNKKARQL